jgi:Ca-activated chloride channel family protein
MPARIHPLLASALALSFVVALSVALALSLAAPASASQPNAARTGSVQALPTAGLTAKPFTAPGGKRGWKVTIPGGRALATPAVVGGMVFVGGGFGSNEFYAFDAATGAPRWAIRVSDDGPTAAVVADGRVVFNTESCTLFVVDAKTGKQLWSRWLGDPLMSQPAVHAGVVYMAYPGADGTHRLAAMRLEDGKTIFERPIAGDVITAPVVDGDSIYLTTTDGTVYRHALTDGRLLLQKQMNATSAPTVAGGEIYVAQNDPAAPKGGARKEGIRRMDKGGGYQGELHASKDAAYLDSRVQDRSGYATKATASDASVGFGGGAPATAKAAGAKANIGQGTVRGIWEFQGSRPTAVKDRNYVTQGDVVRGLDRVSGRVLWEKKLAGDAAKVGGHLGTPPAYAAGKLVVGTAQGDVVAYAAEGGAELFRVPTGEEIRFQPALVGGRIFVGTGAGTLLAIDTGDATLDGWTMWGGGPEHDGPGAGVRRGERAVLRRIGAPHPSRVSRATSPAYRGTRSSSAIGRREASSGSPRAQPAPLRSTTVMCAPVRPSGRRMWCEIRNPSAVPGVSSIHRTSSAAVGVRRVAVHPA